MKWYLDSSAIVKLVQREAETAALRRYLKGRREGVLFTSSLSRVEVVRALAAGGPTAIEQARLQLGRLAQVALTPELLDAAATLAPDARLRSLDAIHLAAAQLAGSDLAAVITYDQRMSAAAGQLGMAVQSPS